MNKNDRRILMNTVLCPSCCVELISLTPSVTSDTTDRRYCPRCRLLYAVWDDSYGTALNPVKKAVIMGAMPYD